MIIQRPTEDTRFKKLGPWVYVYGRRKTGKTFFVKNFTDWDEYFFVRKDSSLFDKDEKELTYEAFFELFKRLIENKKIVIDEVHRLPESFFDYLHSIGVRGNLTVVSSTLWYSQKLLGQGSPLLGLFSPLCFNIIDEQDMLQSLHCKGKERIEEAIYLREPWILPKFRGNVREFLPSFLREHKSVIKALIGEIFSEEERQLSLVYEGILRAVAGKKNISTEISSYLFSRKLIPKDNPGLIQRYLTVLKDIGLIEKLSVFGTRKFRYYHTSPIFDLHFYLEEKYAYTETDVPEAFIKDVVEAKLPFHVEKFFASLLSKKLGMKQVIVERPETDIALVKFDKVKFVGEVKWGSVKQSELDKVAKTLSLFKGAEKVMIVPNKGSLKSDLKLLTCEDF